jgi:hypothetical protein
MPRPGLLAGCTNTATGFDVIPLAVPAVVTIPVDAECSVVACACVASTVSHADVNVLMDSINLAEPGINKPTAWRMAAASLFIIVPAVKINRLTGTHH